MEVTELLAAEGTVVEGKANPVEEAPQRVLAHGIDLIGAPESAQFKIVTCGTVRIPLKHSESRTVIIAVSATVFTMEC